MTQLALFEPVARRPVAPECALAPLPAPFTSPVRRIFALIDIAEQELAAAAKAHPDKAFEINASFMLVAPSPGMAMLAPDVYRSHCRELLERVIRGQNTDPGTDAECLALALDTSLMAPYGSMGSALCSRLFLSVFGRLPDGVEDDVREPWPGAVDDELQRLRRRIGRTRRRST